SRRRHTRFSRDWSSDVCSSDLGENGDYEFSAAPSALTLVFARGESLVVQYHGSGNCGATNANFTLGTDKFSLAESQIYPNPARKIGRASCRERVLTTAVDVS